MGLKKFKRSHHRKYCIDVVQNKYLQLSKCGNHKDKMEKRKENDAIARGDEDSGDMPPSRDEQSSSGEGVPPEAPLFALGATLYTRENRAMASAQLMQRTTRQKTRTNKDGHQFQRLEDGCEKMGDQVEKVILTKGKKKVLQEEAPPPDEVSSVTSGEYNVQDTQKGKADEVSSPLGSTISQGDHAPRYDTYKDADLRKAAPSLGVATCKEERFSMDKRRTWIGSPHNETWNAGAC